MKYDYQFKAFKYEDGHIGYTDLGTPGVPYYADDGELCFDCTVAYVKFMGKWKNE